MKAQTKKVLGIIGNTLLWLFVAFSIIITVLVLSSQSNDAGLPNIGGKSMVNILSDSMAPTFKKGDMIIVKSITNQEAHDLEIGEVITYYVDLNGDGEDEINTHRIVGKEERGGYTYYTTKGDNNGAKDTGEVVSNKVLGVYTGTRIGIVGKIMNFLRQPVGFLCVIVIPLVLFFLFELYNFIIAIIRLQGKKTITKADEEKIRQEAIAEYLRRQNEEKESTKKSAESDKKDE